MINVDRIKISKECMEQLVQEINDEVTLQKQKYEKFFNYINRDD